MWGKTALSLRSPRVFIEGGTCGTGGNNATMQQRNTTMQQCNSATMQHNNVTVQQCNTTMQQCNTTMQQCNNATQQCNSATMQHNNATQQCNNATMQHNNATQQRNNATMQHNNATVQQCNNATQQCNKAPHVRPTTPPPNPQLLCQPNQQQPPQCGAQPSCCTCGAVGSHCLLWDLIVPHRAVGVSLSPMGSRCPL